MDKLSEVLNHFSISAGVFYTGGLCGLSNFDANGHDYGHLHLLQSGRVQVLADSHRAIEVTEPSLLFYPKPYKHRLKATEDDKAEIVCATMSYGAGLHNPIVNALPEFLIVPLSQAPQITHTAQWLFAEGFEPREGRAAIMDRLCELLVLQLLRYLVESNQIQSGLLAGLSHPNVSRLLTALHQDPSQSWNLEQMAAVALMSRSKFAEVFKKTMGQTPADYLVQWRVSIAQTLLQKGKPVNWVANEVGYENGSALARVFRKKTGMSPKVWQQTQALPA